MKSFVAVCIIVLAFTSCSSVKSTTTIKPMDSFILGNNEHGSFRVKLKNPSRSDIEVYKAPIAGGKHSSQIIKPNATVNLHVDPNTALFIQNNSKDTVSVNLKVTGDVGLSMGYKN